MIPPPITAPVAIEIANRIAATAPTAAAPAIFSASSIFIRSRAAATVSAALFISKVFADSYVFSPSPATKAPQFEQYLAPSASAASQWGHKRVRFSVITTVLDRSGIGDIAY